MCSWNKDLVRILLNIAIGSEIFNFATMLMRRRVRWLIYMRKINILQTFCSGSSIGENVQFEDISISPSLTFYPLSSSETCMNKSNSPSSSRRDLLGRGPQQNHKIPRKISQFFHHMDTFGRKVNKVIKSLTPFCCVLSWSGELGKVLLLSVN